MLSTLGPRAFSKLMTGESGSAVPWVERAVQTGWRNCRWARMDPLLAPGLSDPGVERVITQVEGMVAEMRQSATGGISP